MQSRLQDQVLIASVPRSLGPPCARPGVFKLVFGNVLYPDL